MTHNEKLKFVLEQKKLDITQLVRYVFVLENEHEEFLCIHKTEQADDTAIYLGWLLFSDMDWGSNLNNCDILLSTKKAIHQFTRLSPPTSDIAVISITTDNYHAYDILHIVFYVKFQDTSLFEFWYEFDTEAIWIKKDKALDLLSFPIDQKIVALDLVHLPNLLL